MTITTTYKKLTDKNTFFCFSPPVMIATFFIEIALLIYSLIRYKLTTKISRITASTLLLLAIFQLAEYFVCTGHGLGGLVWSRIGYVAITILPPLGLHLIYSITNTQNKSLIASSYTAAIMLAVLFTFVPTVINSTVCTGNYTLFHLIPTFDILYGVYYNSLLILTFVLTLIKRHNTVDSNQRSALKWLAIGYLLFYIPSGVLYYIQPVLASAIPSIMCGFAIMYALIIVIKIQPLTLNKKGDT